jgi:hypothetical protein
VVLKEIIQVIEIEYPVHIGIAKKNFGITCYYK